MDAVGLASSVISFIEFALKLIRGSYEVYKSSTGATVEHDHTTRIVEDLKKVAAQLRHKLQGPGDEELSELAEACYGLSDDLTQLLLRFLPKKPGRWPAFVAACRILRKQKEVEVLESRLDRYRQQISQRLIVLLLYVSPQRDRTHVGETDEVKANSSPL